MNLLIAAALLVTHAAAQGGRAAVIDAELSAGEWDPSIRIRLDVASGRYTVRQNRPRTPRRLRAWAPVKRGTLAASALADVRVATDAALQIGLRETPCGGEIVISNGGPESLRLTTGRQRLRTPDDRGCWSEQANALHGLLGQNFDS